MYLVSVDFNELKLQPNYSYATVNKSKIPGP